MQLEAEAERLKRKDIILSEAKKASEINVADGMKQSAILRAQGEAEAITIKAEKEKEGLNYLNSVISGDNSGKGKVALNYMIRHRFYDEYSKVLNKSNITIIPDDSSKQGGGNGDLLGVVAMMMNAGNMAGRTQSQANTEPQTQSVDSFNKDNNPTTWP